MKTLKGGVNLNAIFPPLNMALMEYLVHVSSNPKTLCSSRESMLWCGVFCEFSGDFWVYLGGDSFSRRIGKIKRNKKY